MSLKYFENEAVGHATDDTKCGGLRVNELQKNARN